MTSRVLFVVEQPAHWNRPDLLVDFRCTLSGESRVCYEREALCGSRFDEIYVCLKKPYSQACENWLNESVLTCLTPGGKYFG